jgi:hypothetical protein
VRGQHPSGQGTRDAIHASLTRNGSHDGARARHFVTRSPPLDRSFRPLPLTAATAVRGRVADGVLAPHHSAVLQLCAQRDALLGADGWQHLCSCWAGGGADARQGRHLTQGAQRKAGRAPCRGFTGDPGRRPGACAAPGESQLTIEPSGMRATRLNRKIADSRERKKVRAPAKKKLPARVEGAGARCPHVERRAPACCAHLRMAAQKCAGAGKHAPGWGKSRQRHVGPHLCCHLQS